MAISNDMTAALHNLGCKVNAYETEAMRERLEEAGYRIVDFDERADVYVINTCTVTAIADKKSRQMLRRAKRLNPEAIVVAAGCYVKSENSEAVRETADIILGNRAKDRLIEAIEEYRASLKTVEYMPDIDDKGCEYESMSLKHPTDHTRAFLKIQDGCDRFCSYCRIPYARGRAVSRDYDETIEEARVLAGNGFKEIVLTGIHLSSYETAGEPGLLRLIEGLSDIDGLKRIRLSSLEPVIVTRDFAREAAGYKKVCPHFHLSLQSGCDKTLRAMNRRYNTEEFRQSCEYLREYYDDPAITTDIIAGFPGESEEDFRESLEFVREIGFYEMHVFPYSKREGTRAASMAGHLNRSVREERAHRLIEAAEEMTAAYIGRHVDREAEVLFEEELAVGGLRGYSGFTREYIRVICTDEGIMPGDIKQGICSKELEDRVMLFTES